LSELKFIEPHEIFGETFNESIYLILMLYLESSSNKDHSFQEKRGSQDRKWMQPQEESYIQNRHDPYRLNHQGREEYTL